MPPLEFDVDLISQPEETSAQLVKLNLLYKHNKIIKKVYIDLIKSL